MIGLDKSRGGKTQPENACLPRASPSGDMHFLGGTNLHDNLQTGQ